MASHTPPVQKPLTVAVAGGSGLIGTALRAELHARGHRVVQLVRSTSRRSSATSAPSTDRILWDPAAGRLDIDALREVDAVVNLAGAGTGDKRWDAAYKDLIERSRVSTTQTLATGLAQLDDRPRVLANGSAIGYYGPDRGDEHLTEESQPGTGFLAGVCSHWEAATTPAAAAGHRVVLLRTGLVVTPAGGLFARLLPLYRAGLGGPLGRGRMWWSTISLRDEVGAIIHLIQSPDAVGPANLVAPEPSRNADFSRHLAAALHRPHLVRVPPPALRMAFGEFADDMLGSLRVTPGALERSGYMFQDPTTAAIIRRALDEGVGT